MFNDFEPAVLKKRLEVWLANGGEEELVALKRRTAEERKNIQAVLRVDYETLRQPMTI